MSLLIIDGNRLTTIFSYQPNKRMTDDLCFNIDVWQPNENEKSLRHVLKRVNASLEAYRGTKVVSSFHVEVKICFEKEEELPQKRQRREGRQPRSGERCLSATEAPLR